MLGINNILVVCVGNICRSPVAEFLLQRDLVDIRVHSAGLGALVGHDVEPMARSVAEADGLKCPQHNARQLTASHCREADLILVMERRHRDDVASLCPEARGKIFLFGQGLPNPDIPDPYRKSGDMFEAVYMLLTLASQNWVRRLQPALT